MKLHEHQAKTIFADAGIPGTDSRLATTVVDEALAVDEIGYPAAIKAQVHVGGRGKAGGIKIATDRDEAEQYAEEILGMDLKVHRRSDPRRTGRRLRRRTVRRRHDGPGRGTAGSDGLDRGRREHRGGRRGEPRRDRASTSTRVRAPPVSGPQVVYEAGVDADVALDVASILTTLYDLYEENDASEIEVNPVMITSDRDVIAADAVMNIDEDALFRHPDLAEMAEESYEDDLERKAGEYGFDYVRLSGNVGIIGNGAGLVMTTLDLVDYYGGKPANFLDIGGGAKAERVTKALDMVFRRERRCRRVQHLRRDHSRRRGRQGINEALEQFDEIPKKVVVRLAGTNAEEGWRS